MVGRAIDMPIFIEGSGMPTMIPKIGSPVYGLGAGGKWINGQYGILRKA